jgi:hypothetical protein
LKRRRIIIMAYGLREITCPVCRSVIASGRLNELPLKLIKLFSVEERIRENETTENFSFVSLLLGKCGAGSQPHAFALFPGVATRHEGSSEFL